VGNSNAELKSWQVSLVQSVRFRPTFEFGDTVDDDTVGNALHGSPSQEQQLYYLSMAQALALHRKFKTSFESKAYGKALSLCGRGISILEELPPLSIPDRIHLRVQLAVFYMDRAAMQFELGYPESCLSDCHHIVHQLNPHATQEYIFASKAAVRQGRLEDANSLIQIGTQVSAMTATAQRKLQEQESIVSKLVLVEQKGNDRLQAANQTSFQEAREAFGQLVEEAPEAVRCSEICFYGRHQICLQKESFSVPS
jgi:hypothetical protein